MGFTTDDPKGPGRTRAINARAASQASGTDYVKGGMYNPDNNQQAQRINDQDPIFANLSKGEAIAKRHQDFGLGSNNSPEAQAMADKATAIGDQYGSDFNGLASQNQQRSDDALNRGLSAYRGDTTQYRQGLANAADARAKQSDSYSALMGFANQGPGPSAAQAQLTQATDANTQNALAMARSGRGMGGGQAALRQAMAQNAGTQQTANSQMAELRANENTAYQAQRLNALNAGGGLATSIAGTDLSGAQQGLAGAQYATDTALKGTQLNDASAQNWATQRANATQQALGAEMGGQTQALNVNSTALTGRENEYASANSTYATDKGLSQAAAIADANRQQAYTGAALSAAGTVAGALSDERAKKNIQPLSTWGTGDDGVEAEPDVVSGAFGAGLSAAGNALQGKASAPLKRKEAKGEGAKETADGKPAKPTIREAARGAFDPISQGSDMVRGADQSYTFGDRAGVSEYFAPAQHRTGPHDAQMINPANNPFLSSDERAKQDISPLGTPSSVQPQTIGTVAPLASAAGPSNGSVAGTASGPSLAQKEEAKDEKAGQTGQTAGKTAGSVVGGAAFGPVGAVAGNVIGGAIGKTLGKVFSDVRGKDPIVPLDFNREAAKYGASGIVDSPKAVARYADASPAQVRRMAREDEPILSKGDALLANSARSVPGSVYEYKDPEAPGAKPGRQVGPMAQDLAANPLTRGTVVKDKRSGMLGVDTPRLTLYNTAAQHAQQNQLDALDAKIGDLTSLLKRKPGEEFANFARSTGGQ